MIAQLYITTNKNTMSYTSQQFTSAILQYLDNKIWDKVALKIIEKIPRKVNTREIESNFEEFVSMNSSALGKANQRLVSDREVNGKISEKMIGSPNMIKRERRTVTETSSKPQSQISRQRVKKLASRVQTEGTSHLPIQDSQQTSINSSSAHPLFLSEAVKNRDNRMQDYFRASKNEQDKFNKKQSQDCLERDKRRQESYNTQKNKLKNMQRFTYDYEGTVLSVNAAKQTNTKVLNIKYEFIVIRSFFKSNNQKTKQNASKKMSIKESPEKMGAVQTKKVIAMEHYRRDDENSDAEVNRLGKTTPVNLIKMFKGDQSVQMGVSFTDILANSTIKGPSQAKLPNNSMKLSEYKERNSSHFKPIKHRSKTQERMKSRGSRREIMRLQPKQAIRQLSFERKSGSNAESRVLSSSFSHFKKGMGFILKNPALYALNFEENQQ